jgi:hypothetical protein
MLSFNDFKKTFLNWSDTLIEPKQDSGSPICPYARKARLQNKIQFIDARENLSEMDTFDRDAYEIGIAWLGDIDNIDPVGKFCEQSMLANPDLLYFTSTRSSGHFVKNFTDCVFIQLKDDILAKRQHLKSTDYYDNWPKNYYNKIMEN